MSDDMSLPVPSAEITPENSTYRMPPVNVEIEQGLLGALLTNNSVYERVSEYIDASHFFDPAHRRIFDVAARLIERGQVANPVTLRSYFLNDGDLDEIGGAEYLINLAENTISVINALDYAKILMDLAMRRDLIDVGEELVNNAYDFDPDIAATDHLELTEQKLFHLAEQGQSEGGFHKLVDATIDAVKTAEKAFQRTSHVTGITTGFKDLDYKIGGLHPSDLIILAGRPSMGKTALVTNLAFNTAKAYLSDQSLGGGVAFFSLEMSAEQLANRILSAESGVLSDRIRKGDLDQDDFSKFAEVVALMERIPFHIDESPALTISAMRSRCRRLKRTQGLGLIIVDYLQLMQGSPAQKNESRVQEISAITRGLKGLAKELDVPVIALSQLSRAVEQREDKRPQLADLRESGSIEQDADIVMFIYREEYYLSRAEPKQKPEEDLAQFQERMQSWQELSDKAHNVAEVIIAKQRHGPIGTVPLFFDSNLTKFGDLIREYQVPEE